MGANSLEVAEFLARSAGLPLVDVRSPAEYRHAHIPTALNLPLFSDEERAQVGTLYKQRGKKAAVLKGLEITGPKMRSFVEQAETLNKASLAVYCWRGGMRSESMAWLLQQYGFECHVLKGGYKAYRRHLRTFFEQDLPLTVLTGYTGSKKTALLHLLQKKGEQVIDLEGLAGHQGSSFGNQKCQQQPSTEHFQNLLFEAFRQLDLSRPIWIEDESMRIGQVDLPEALFRQMSRKPHVFLEIDKAQRIDFLLLDYKSLSKEQLITATRAISKKLGYDKATEAIWHIEAGQLRQAAEIILTYYDKSYYQSISRKQHLIQAHYHIDMDQLEDLAETLVNTQRHVL